MKRARTENKRIVYPKTSPNENVETDQQGEQRKNKQSTINLEKGSPRWYCVSRVFLEGWNRSASATHQVNQEEGASYKDRLRAQ